MLFVVKSMDIILVTEQNTIELRLFLVEKGIVFFV